MKRCSYPPPRCSAEVSRDELSLPSPPYSTLSPLPSVPSDSECWGLFQPSRRSSPAFVDPNVDSAQLSLPISNNDLFQHYLSHTSRTLTCCLKDQTALRTGMPTLAMRSKTVFHSLLAVSATCLCCDIISKELHPDPDMVGQILDTAYRHYDLASQGMRELMSQQRDARKPEVLLASTMLLVPFAAASQQIKHWISKQTETSLPEKLLSSTPRDVIIMMRGVRTMLQTIMRDDEFLNTGDLSTLEYSTDDHSWSEECSSSLVSPTTSRKHVMFPILASTSEAAFSKLQERLTLALLEDSGTSASLFACSAAFDIVDNLRANIFSPGTQIVEESYNIQKASTLKIAPWLRSFACRPPSSHPSEPLTRYLLTFLVQTPQSYLDLVLPLLDQRLEVSIRDSTPEPMTNDLTREQALALDIYAHWSVLMFLVQEETFWIGNIPEVSLTGMLNRFGDDYMSRLWPGDSCGDGREWPWSMLKILREISQCR